MLIKLESNKRPIVKVNVNNKEAYMLIDTGASLGVIDSNQLKDYNLEKYRKLSTTVVGVGGKEQNAYDLRPYILDIEGIKLHQFATFDLSSVVDSIKRETNIKILGVIGTLQIKMSEMKIDLDNNQILLGY